MTFIRPPKAAPAVPTCEPSEFAKPSALFRGKPFWSWNGKLEREELLRQLEVARSMGMGGVFMHARTGLETAYLGPEWFELTRACADAAAELGLEAWLYDEDRWPSGSAGGIVTRDINLRMRSMCLRIVRPGAQIEWPDKSDLLGAYLADLSGLDLHHYRPVAHGALTECPDNATVLLIVREVHPGHSFYNGATYLDTLSAAATQRFLEVTHAAYARECGEQLGRAINGIFTDEPHRGFIFCEAPAQPGATDSGNSAPYTEGLFEEYSKRFGERLEHRLPELFLRFRGQRHSDLKWRYVELLQQLFLENWARPCLDWCHRHGLRLTGHVLHEDSLAAQAVPCGSLARYYEHLDHPGIDVLGLENRAFWIAKQVVSVARQFGKPFVLSELYGCTGWQLDFDGHKEIGDWQAVLGVNVRCHHLSWYTMAGESKRDYPASIFHQSSWYQEYHYIEDYYARLHLALAQGAPDCDVLVLHPIESLWAQIHVNWATWLQSASAPVLELQRKFEQLFGWLTGAQIDFDYGDEEQLGRLGAIGTSSEGTWLRLGQMRYRAVVVGGLETLRTSTLRILNAFHEAGGSVIFAGPPPSHLDALPSKVPSAFARKVMAVSWKSDEIRTALRTCSRQSLRVDVEGGSGDSLLAHVRLLPNGERFVAIVNTSREPAGRTLLRLAASGHVEEWDCRSGTIRRVRATEADGVLRWKSDFGSLRERLFRITPHAASNVALEPELQLDSSANVHVLDGPFAFELSEPNVCVLDHARFLLGENQAGEDDILRIDATVRSRLGWPARSGVMVQPWCRENSPASGPRLELRFSFEVDVMPGSLELCLEQPERWDVRLNSAPANASLRPGLYIDQCLKRLPLPLAAVRRGANELLLSTELREDTQLEAIYLLGPFGVALREASRVLTGLPATLAVGDITLQGLPFYGGVVTYLIPAPVTLATLEVRSFSGACLKLRTASDKAGRVLGFSPFLADVQPSDGPLRLDAFLTRQNMFGPLHRNPPLQNFTGPESFRTNGSAWSNIPLLHPSGLLSVPRYFKRR